MNKYCRICWNSKHWHEPTGEAAKLEKGKAFVRKNGFGHEEWLFNFSWLQPGPKGESGLFRYGFLQPIGKYRSKYQGQTFDIFLYTVTPEKKRLAIGIIRELYVPSDDELKTAYQYMRKRSWLNEMARDLSSLTLDPRVLTGPPGNIINVRFQQANVEFFDPRFILPKDHVTYRIDRYQPLNWMGAAPRATRPTARRRQPGSAKRKSETARTRAAIESTTYSPRHNILQNALDKFLRRMYGQNTETLAIELQALTEIDLGFDIETIGFEMGEIDLLIDGLSDDEDEIDQVPGIDRTLSPVSQVGDLWQVGEHRLLCGDCLEAASYTRLLGGELAEMVFTDPPYNARINGHVSGLGAVKHAEFVMASGEMSEAEFTSFLEKALANLSAVSVDGAIHFVCMDWRHLFELLVAGRVVYSELKNLCVWAKSNGGMGSLYRSRHELIAVFKHGTASHINNVELGRFGRNRTNVWEYAGINAFSAKRDEELAMHPTVKPVALVEDAIKDCSRRGGIVLDAFAGSGTTLIAAERAGRRGFGIELDPHYADVILERFRTEFGEEPLHVESGLTFSELK